MTYDAIVIGLGGMGSATLARAARRGLRVLGVDRFREGHAFGASSGRSRLIRKAYFEDPAYVPLLLRAYELWRDLERDSGTKILRTTGVVIAGAPGSPIVEGTRAAARQHGLPLDEFDAAALLARFPAFAPRADEVAVYEPDAGMLSPETAVAAQLRIARAAGAEVRFGARTARWDADGGAVRVVLDTGETFEGRRLALCAGPWLRELAPDENLPITLQRNVLVWFEPDGGFDAGALPVSLIDRAEFPQPLAVYSDLGDGVKAGFHGYGATTHPDELDRVISPSDVEPVRVATNEWIPGAAGRFIEGQACMYALTPDKNFALGTLSEAPRVVVAGGFSGHGFKFAPVIGEIVTDLLVDGATRHDIAFLAPSRFAASKT